MKKIILRVAIFTVPVLIALIVFLVIGFSGEINAEITDGSLIINSLDNHREIELSNIKKVEYRDADDFSFENVRIGGGNIKIKICVYGDKNFDNATVNAFVYNSAEKYVTLYLDTGTIYIVGLKNETKTRELFEELYRSIYD